MSQPIKTKPMATFRVSFPSLFAKAITHSPKVSWYFEKRKSFKSVGEFYSSKLFKEKRQHGLCISFSCFRQIISIWHSSFTAFIVFTADFFIFISFCDECGAPYRLPCGKDCEIALFYSSESVLCVRA